MLSQRTIVPTVHLRQVADRRRRRSYRACSPSSRRRSTLLPFDWCCSTTPARATAATCGQYTVRYYRCTRTRFTRARVNLVRMVRPGGGPERRTDRNTSSTTSLDRSRRLFVPSCRNPPAHSSSRTKGLSTYRPLRRTSHSAGRVSRYTIDCSEAPCSVSAPALPPARAPI